MQKERWKIFKLLFMLYVFCRVRTIFFMSEYFCGIFVCHINMNITYHHPLRFRFSFVAILFFFSSLVATAAGLRLVARLIPTAMDATSNHQTIYRFR